MAGTVLTDSDDECRVNARPVRQTKPTAILLQHSERAALPSQTKAINAFRAAEAAKRAAETQQVADPGHSLSQNSSFSNSTVLLGSSSAAPEQGKRVRVEETAAVIDSNQVDDDGQFFGDDDDTEIRENAYVNPKSKKRRVEAQPDDVDADGIPIDVDVQAIVDVSPTREGMVVFL
ncbi:hypothetical protein C8R48DRAFT_670787 [Suillus tomentosus]|nr:hypothetical protein C8R48DRAFT_670787 [Suillus tomentosus]